MSTWVVPESSTECEQAQDGDVVLRPVGDVVVVGRVTADAVEWLGPVPEGALAVPTVTEAEQRPELDADAETLASAASALGG